MSATELTVRAFFIDIGLMFLSGFEVFKVAEEFSVFVLVVEGQKFFGVFFLRPVSCHEAVSDQASDFLVVPVVKVRPQGQGAVGLEPEKL